MASIFLPQCSLTASFHKNRIVLHICNSFPVSSLPVNPSPLCPSSTLYFSISLFVHYFCARYVHGPEQLATEFQNKTLENIKAILSMSSNYINTLLCAYLYKYLNAPKYYGGDWMLVHIVCVWKASYSRIQQLRLKRAM